MDRPLSEVIITFTLLAIAAFSSVGIVSWHNSWEQVFKQSELLACSREVILSIYQLAIKAKLTNASSTAVILFNRPISIVGNNESFLISNGYATRKFAMNGFAFSGVASGLRVNITCTPSLKVIFDEVK